MRPHIIEVKTTEAKEKVADALSHIKEDTISLVGCQRMTMFATALSIKLRNNILCKPFFDYTFINEITRYSCKLKLLNITLKHN